MWDMSGSNLRHKGEFQLIRYVPDRTRNEFVNVGVLFWQENAERDGKPQMELRFTRDWRRLRCLDPDADTTVLEGIEAELRNRLANDAEGKMRRIVEESFSNNVQLTPTQGHLAESLPAGIEELMRI